MFLFDSPLRNRLQRLCSCAVTTIEKWKGKEVPWWVWHHAHAWTRLLASCDFCSLTHVFVLTNSHSGCAFALSLLLLGLLYQYLAWGYASFALMLQSSSKRLEKSPVWSYLQEQVPIFGAWKRNGQLILQIHTMYGEFIWDEFAEKNPSHGDTVCYFHFSVVLVQSGWESNHN